MKKFLLLLWLVFGCNPTVQITSVVIRDGSFRGTTERGKFNFQIADLKGMDIRQEGKFLYIQVVDHVNQMHRFKIAIVHPDIQILSQLPTQLLDAPSREIVQKLSK